jgi:hypothetical protein
MAYAFNKWRLMFCKFEKGEVCVKMWKPNKKKPMLINWEDFYLFVRYKDGNGVPK